MILSCIGVYVTFKIESLYFCMTEFNMHNRNEFCIHAFCLSSTAIAQISGNLKH